jgi:hypothetical protein
MEPDDHCRGVLPQFIPFISYFVHSYSSPFVDWKFLYFQSIVQVVLHN